MIPVFNLTNIPQIVGPWSLSPSAFTDVPYDLAVRLAEQEKYQVDDDRLIGDDYKFMDEDGTYLGWSSPLYYADGYGSIAQEIAAEFLRMGVGLSIYPRDYDPSHSKYGELSLGQWQEKAFVPAEIVNRLMQKQERTFYGINMTWPPDAPYSPFPRSIAYTMFETDCPPMKWAENLNKCRRIIVPCKQNVDAFRNIGVHVPIDVAQQGANPDTWTYLDRSKRKRNKPFTFLMMAGLTYRKNPLGAARAFVAAFPKTENVQLILKTRGTQTASGFRSFIKHLPDDPRIQVVCEESTPSEMVEWMHKTDAFVFPSRGEGFGLTPVQAMCTGLPVIVSDNSGMSEYCDARYNYPIPCSKVPVPRHADGGYPDSWGYCGSWWNPDFDALVETYRQVYGNPQAAWRKGKLAADWVRSDWTINLTCERIMASVHADANESGLI